MFVSLLSKTKFINGLVPRNVNQQLITKTIEKNGSTTTTSNISSLSETNKRFISNTKLVNGSKLSSFDGKLVSFENGFNFNGRSFIILNASTTKNFQNNTTTNVHSLRGIHTSKSLKVDENKNNNDKNNTNDVNNNNNNTNNSADQTSSTNTEKKVDHNDDPNLLKETMKPILNWDEYFESMRQQQESQRDRMKELPHRPWEDNRIWSSILRWWSNRFPKTKLRRAAEKEEAAEAKAKGEEFIPKFDDEPSWVHQWRQQSGRWWR